MSEALAESDQAPPFRPPQRPREEDGEADVRKPEPFPWFPAPLLEKGTGAAVVSDQPNAQAQLEEPERRSTYHTAYPPFPADVLPASPDELAAAAGHFREPVAQGAFGKVFYARNGLRGRRAAIKVSHNADDSATAERAFWNEVEVLKACRGCAFVLQLLSYGFAFVNGQRRFALSYPWFDRGDLSMRLHRRGHWPVLTSEERHTALQCVALGIEAVHRRYYAHMDVCAKNILLRASDDSASGVEAVLCDPGNAVPFPGGRFAYSEFGQHGTSATPANARQLRSDAQDRFQGRARAGAAAKLPTEPEPSPVPNTSDAEPNTSDADLGSDPADAADISAGATSASNEGAPRPPLLEPLGTPGYAAPELYLMEVHDLCKLTEDALNESVPQGEYEWDAPLPAARLPLVHPAWCDCYGLGVVALEVLTGNLPVRPSNPLLTRDARPSDAGETPGFAFVPNARRILLDHEGSLIEGSWDDLVDESADFGPAMSKSLALVATAATHPDARMRMHVSDAAAVLQSGYHAFRKRRNVTEANMSAGMKQTDDAPIVRAHYTGGYGLTNTLGLVSTTADVLLDRGNAAGRAGGAFHHRHRFHERSPFEGSPGGIPPVPNPALDELRALTPRWLLDYEHFRDVDLGFCNRGGKPKNIHGQKNGRRASERTERKLSARSANSMPGSSKSYQHAEHASARELTPWRRTPSGATPPAAPPATPPMEEAAEPREPAPAPAPAPAPVIPELVDPLAETRRIEEETSWRIAYGKLEKFYVRHGHCHVPRGFPGLEEIAEWLESQRVLYMRGELNEAREAKLAMLGVELSKIRIRAPDAYGVDKTKVPVLERTSPFIAGSVMASVAKLPLRVPIAGGAKGSVMGHGAGAKLGTSCGLPRIGVEALPQVRPRHALSRLHSAKSSPDKLLSPEPSATVHSVPISPASSPEAEHDADPTAGDAANPGVRNGKPDENTFVRLDFEHRHWADSNFQYRPRRLVLPPDAPETVQTGDEAPEAAQGYEQPELASEAGPDPPNTAHSAPAGPDPPNTAHSAPARIRVASAKRQSSNASQVRERRYVAKTRYGRQVSITMIEHPPMLDANLKSNFAVRMTPALLIMGDTYDSKKMMKIQWAQKAEKMRLMREEEKAIDAGAAVKITSRVSTPSTEGGVSSHLMEYSDMNPPTRQSTPAARLGTPKSPKLGRPPALPTKPSERGSTPPTEWSRNDGSL